MSYAGIPNIDLSDKLRLERQIRDIDAILLESRTSSGNDYDQTLPQDLDGTIRRDLQSGDIGEIPWELEEADC